jgi:hypothetical protein
MYDEKFLEYHLTPIPYTKTKWTLNTGPSLCLLAEHQKQEDVLTPNRQTSEQQAAAVSTIGLFETFLDDPPVKLSTNCHLPDSCLP